MHPSSFPLFPCGTTNRTVARKAPTAISSQAKPLGTSAADLRIQAYKSIRRGKAGPISAALNTDKYGWEAATTAIVGSDKTDQDDSRS